MGKKCYKEIKTKSTSYYCKNNVKVNGVTFIWFTDGLGWLGARKNLEETFNEMDTIYNIDDLEHGVIETLK